MKTLILTEKPSVARDFSQALTISSRRDGFFENDSFLITWAVGHLLELKDPADYDKRWKKWTLGSLPILPERLLYKANQKTKAQLAIILNLLERKDLERIVIATDAGREGELIGRTILAERKTNAELFRFWTSQALSPEVIKKEMSNLKPLSEYDRLYYAGRARQSADWLVGMNLSRLATIKMGDLFSVGRVQTAVLSLLVKRREEIDSFEAKPFFILDGKFLFQEGDISARYFDASIKEKNSQIKTEAEALNILKSCEGHPVRIESVEKEKKSQVPPQLFSLTELQKVANRLFGFSAKQTLSLAQELYEKYKCLSYPRTDARVLGTESLLAVKEILKEFKASNPNDFVSFAPERVSLKNRRVFDDSKLTDHHALIPLKNVSLNGDSKKLFDLVLKRFVAVFSENFVYEDTTVISTVNNHKFKSSGVRIVSKGWKALEGQSHEKHVPPLAEKDVGTIDSLKIERKMTQPPMEYTEASLLQDMINPSRLVEDKAYKKAFRGDVGLGTQATRAQIIETLLTRNYVERKGKNLIALAKGQFLIKNLLAMNCSKSIACPEETAKWELELDNIARGEGSPRDFMINMRAFIVKCAEEWKEASLSFVPTQGTDEIIGDTFGKCPLCKSHVIESSKSYSCQKWREGCKFAIWKKIAGKPISATQVKKILESGKSDLLKGFKSKTGKKFDAGLEVKNNGVSFVF